MAFTFDEADRAFRNDRINDLAQDPEGLRFLRLRSLYRASRPHYVEELIRVSGTAVRGISTSRDLRALHESGVKIQDIDRTIKKIHQEERKEREVYKPSLITELYNVKVFDWGGLHQNSLEKTIVDNYVKKIRSYSELECKIENELQNSMRGYVLCSWYNHWTSIIIEDIFRNHKRIIPTVGQIAKIDFFIDNVPFDLKVTYLPEGFIKDKRRKIGLRPELTELKRLARSLAVYFDQNTPESKLLEDLWMRLRDHPKPAADALVDELKRIRMEILSEAEARPEELIEWLYENQGVRRFDASNRLFLVLVDCGNFFESWKLKRAKELLESKIHNHLDQMGTSPGLRVSFMWERTRHTVTSDVIFVRH